MDGAKKDEDGDIWLLGRVDDVMNVSGHRLSTTEIESAPVSDPAVAETAVVGATDETTSQAVVAFVILRGDAVEDTATEATVFGPFLAEDAPKKVNRVVTRRPAHAGNHAGLKERWLTLKACLSRVPARGTGSRRRWLLRRAIRSPRAQLDRLRFKPTASRASNFGWSNAGRSGPFPVRASHLHFMVAAEGYRTLVTTSSLEATRS